MKNSLWAFMLMALLLTAGCTGDTTEQTSDSTETTNTTTEQSNTATQETSKAAAPAPVTAVAGTAEAAVQAVMNGLSTGNATVVWAALPPAYQTDINDVVQAFGNGMDPTQWQQIQGTVAKLHAVLTTKADFIINIPLVQAMGQGEQLKEAIPGIAGLLKTIMDHTDLESLKSFDGQAFFSGPASSLIVQIDALAKLSPNSFSLSSLRNATIETVSSEGDKATLKISNPTDSTKTDEVEFVKVDGHWVPADMASGWDENMAEAKADMSRLPETAQENAMMVAMMTNAVTAGLQPLEAAEDQEQFNTAVEQLQNGMGQMLGPMLFGGFPGGDTTTEFPPDFDPSKIEESPPVEEEPTEESPFELDEESTELPPPAAE